VNILAFDTAMRALSVAVLSRAGDAPATVSGFLEPMRAGHAEALAGRVREQMEEAGLGFSDLDRIAVTVGPGTFTGVRIGLSFARGLKLATGCPVVALTTLEAIAANVSAGEAGNATTPIAVAVDARRGEIYFQMFNADLSPASEPAALAVADAAAFLADRPAMLAGSGAEALADVARAQGATLDVRTGSCEPDARVFAVLALERTVEADPPRPLYLRAPDAKPPAAGTAVARKVRP